MAETNEVPFEVILQLSEALKQFKNAVDDCVIQTNFLLVVDTHASEDKNTRITVRTSDHSSDEYVVIFE